MLREGAASLWRGNVANCLKVAPGKAIKFLMYENVRSLICARPGDTKSEEELSVCFWDPILGSQLDVQMS